MNNNIISKKELEALENLVDAIKKADSEGKVAGINEIRIDDEMIDLIDNIYETSSEKDEKIQKYSKLRQDNQKKVEELSEKAKNINETLKKYFEDKSLER